MKKRIRISIAALFVFLLIIGFCTYGFKENMGFILTPFKKPLPSEILVKYQLSDSTKQEIKDSSVFYLGNPIGLSKGQALLLGDSTKSVSPMVRMGNIFVPLNFISYGLQVDATVNQQKNQVTLSKGNTTILISVNKNIYTIDGITKILPVAPFIEGDVIYLPIKDIAEAFGKKIAYYNGLILISPNNPISIEKEKHIVFDLIYFFNYNAKSSDIDVSRVDNSFGSFNLSLKYSFKIDDAAFHPTKPIIYLVDQNNKKLHLINYHTLKHLSISLDFPPERVKYQNNEIYVTLLKHPHNRSIYQEQEGVIGVFDAYTLKKIDQFDLNIDPFDIALDRAGYIYITPGSGQHSNLETFGIRERHNIDYRNKFRALSFLEIHPTLDRFYTITTDVSPVRITGYEVNKGILGNYLRAPIDSPTYSLNGKIKISPDGKYIFNQHGTMVNCSVDKTKDLTLAKYLDIGPATQNDNFIDAAFDLKTNVMYANISNYINKYEYDNFKLIYSYVTPIAWEHLHTSDGLIIGAADYQIQLINSNTDFSDTGINNNNSELIGENYIDYVQDLSTIKSSQPTSIKDLEKSSVYAKEAILYLANKGIISGDQKGYFNPTQPLKRSELVKIIISALNIDMTYIPSTPTFNDVPVNHWAYAYIETAYRLGIIKGVSKDIFGINDACTREQMSTILIRSLGLEDKSIVQDPSISSLIKDYKAISLWAVKSVAFAYQNDIMKGDNKNNFLPKNHAAKQDMAVIMARYLKDQSRIDNTISNMTKNRPISLILNEDTINLNNYPILIMDKEGAKHNHELLVENGVLMSPLIVLSNIGAEVFESPSAEKVSLVERPSMGDYRSILLQPNDSTAYINVNSSIPLEDIKKMTDKQYLLPTAPKLINNHLYVPIKEVCSALGAELNWYPRYSIAQIVDITAPKHPTVRWISTIAENQKSYFNMSMTFNFGNALAKMEYKAEGKQKGREYFSKATVKIINNDLKKTTNNAYEITKFINPTTFTEETYIKDMNNPSSYKRSLLDIKQGPILSVDIQYLLNKNKDFSYKLFNSDLIQKQENYLLNGEPVTKYSILLNDSSLIKQFFDVIKFPDIKELEYLYSGEIAMDISDAYHINKFVLEKYIDSRGQLVKDVLFYSGIKAKKILDCTGYLQGKNLDVIVKTNFDVNIEATFFDIGKDVEINTPAAQ